MEYLAELPVSNDAIGLIIAGLIFLVTVTLIAKKLISFLVTVVLLFFAIASGMAIAHNDLVRQYFQKEKAPHTREVDQAKHEDSLLEPLRTEVIQLFNRLADLLRTKPAEMDAEDYERSEEPRSNRSIRGAKEEP